MVVKDNEIMKERETFSIFDNLSKKPLPNSKSTFEESLSRNHEETDSNKSSQEIYQMIDKMVKIHDEIERKLDDAFQKSGLTPKYIETYLSNPSNFNNAQWDSIQKKREQLLSQVGKKVNEASESLVSPIKAISKAEEKTTDKTEKERKTKMIGSRRNWIPIR